MRWTPLVAHLSALHLSMKQRARDLMTGVWTRHCHFSYRPPFRPIYAALAALRKDGQRRGHETQIRGESLVSDRFLSSNRSRSQAWTDSGQNQSAGEKMVSLWKRRRASSFRSQGPLQGAFQIASPRVPSVSDHLRCTGCSITLYASRARARGLGCCCCNRNAVANALLHSTVQGRFTCRPPPATDRAVNDRSSIGRIGRPPSGCRHVQWPNRRLVKLNVPGDDDGHRRFRLFRLQLQLQSCRGRTATGGGKRDEPASALMATAVRVQVSHDS